MSIIAIIESVLILKIKMKLKQISHVVIYCDNAEEQNSMLRNCLAINRAPCRLSY